MGRGFLKYFDRKWYKKIEKRLDIRSVIFCWIFNITAALVVFTGVWLLTSNVVLTIIWTLSAWTVTLTVSIIYWVMWVYRKLKKYRKVMIAVLLFILAMFVIALAFIMNAFVLISSAASGVS